MCSLSFHFFYDFLYCAQVFEFDWVLLVYFCFCFIYFGDRKKKLPQFMAKSVLPILSSKNFIVSDLIFRSLIHFEFIFVYGVRKCSNFILLHVTVQFFQHHSLRRLSFSTVYSCLLFNGLIICEQVYLWTFYPVTLTSVSVFCLYHIVLITVAL